jgi:hypothetical protein
MDEHRQELYLPEGGELIKRSKAIHEFFHLNYQLSIDLFVSVSPAAIRQSIRRLNSYTVPINLRRFGEVELDFTHHNARARRFSGARG